MLGKAFFGHMYAVIFIMKMPAEYIEFLAKGVTCNHWGTVTPYRSMGE